MKLRSKFILFLSILFVFLFAVAFVYVYSFVRTSFKDQTLNNLFVLSEEKEATYFTFLKQLKTVGSNWSSDFYIKELSEKIVDQSLPSTVRTKAVHDFSSYLRDKKMRYDASVIMVDLLDERGIVVASSREDRIGLDEGAEEREHQAIYFSKAIMADFGQAFARNLVIEKDEFPNPMFHITTRMFSNTLNEEGVFAPLPAVLLVHLDSLPLLTDLLRGTVKETTEEALTNTGFIQNFKTSDIYLVNKNRLLVTPTRIQETPDFQTYITTEPIEKCFKNGSEEFIGEYVNHYGVRVFGASMCLPNEEIVIMNEISTIEAYEFFNALLAKSIVAGIFIFFSITIVVFLVIRAPFRKISLIADAAGRVARGDFTANIPAKGTDEFSMLAEAFNIMTGRLQKLYRSLETKVSERTLQLKQSVTETEALIGSIGEGIIATDNKGTIIKANRITEKMFGWRADELIGRAFHEALPAYNEKGDPILMKDDVVLSVILTNTSTALTALLVKKDGTQLPVSMIVTPVILGNRTIGTIASMRDITKEREIEKMRIDLLSLASHQLRTPLSGTKWLIETLRKGIHGSLTKEQDEYLEEIYKINERMTGLVSDMLSALRIENGLDSFTRETVSVSSLFDAIEELMIPAARKKNIVIRFTKREQDISLTTARELLRNILESFISNAIVYSPQGTEVIVDVTEDKETVIFSVKDFGIGIPKKEQKDIFSRFYRASNARVVNTRGTGLGLYMSSMLSKKIGARVGFESEEGKGSTFFLWVPKEFKIDLTSTEERLPL